MLLIFDYLCLVYFVSPSSFLDLSVKTFSLFVILCLVPRVPHAYAWVWIFQFGTFLFFEPNKRLFFIYFALSAYSSLPTHDTHAPSVPLQSAPTNHLEFLVLAEQHDPRLASHLQIGVMHWTGCLWEECFFFFFWSYSWFGFFILFIFCMCVLLNFQILDMGTFVASSLFYRSEEF